MSTTTPPFGPRRISFDGCMTVDEAIVRIEAVCDELEAHTVRTYAASLFEDEPAIDADEFQDCVLQFHQAIRHWRDEHREETHQAVRRMLEAGRRQRPAS